MVIINVNRENWHVLGSVLILGLEHAKCLTGYGFRQLVKLECIMLSLIMLTFSKVS